MKNVFIALIVTLSVGCVSSARYAALERRTMELEQKDLDRRQANAKRDGYRPPGAPQLPSANPNQPAVGHPMAGGVQGSQGAMWARRQHGPYMGAVGTYARQMTQGRKIQVNNLVCDDGSRGFGCKDRDRNGEPDYNTWLSFSIIGSGNEAQAVCDSGIVHPALGVTLLPPNQSCFVEVGAAPVVKVKIRFYRNNGNSSYVDLDSKNYKMITKVIEVPNGLFSLDVEEMTTSAE